jgi:hypothetical protein
VIRRLSSTVHVFAPDVGDYVVYGPQDDVPDNHAALMGDHVWAVEGDVDNDGVDSREPGTVPPRAGKGSGREEWLSFAHENDVDVADDADRGAIIAACEAAGVIDPVEQ